MCLKKRFEDLKEELMIPAVVVEFFRLVRTAYSLFHQKWSFFQRCPKQLSSTDQSGSAQCPMMAVLLISESCLIIFRSIYIITDFQSLTFWKSVEKEFAIFFSPLFFFFCYQQVKFIKLCHFDCTQTHKQTHTYTPTYIHTQILLGFTAKTVLHTLKKKQVKLPLFSQRNFWRYQWGFPPR